MGNDISKKDNIDEDFKKKSNLVIDELDSFFGPIQGFILKTGDGRKTEIKSLDDRYKPEFSQEVIDQIKKERNVCNNIIGTYKNSLNGLLKDKVFSQRVNSFIKNKKLDAKNFDINIRITNFKDEPAICDRVMEYYWMKYLVYRMLRNLDPLAEEYALIEKFTKSSRWNNLFDQNYEEANKIKKDLDQQRDRVRELINQNMNQLLQDNLTYDDLMRLYKNLIEDKKLQSYAEEIYNVCENLADLEVSSNPKSYKFSKRGKLKGINLQNYKQIKICERLKTRSKGAPVPPPKPSKFRKPQSIIGRGIFPVRVNTTIPNKLRNPKSILKSTTATARNSTTATARNTANEKVKNKANEIRNYLNKFVESFIFSVNKTNPSQKTYLINLIENFKKESLDEIKEIEDDRYKNNSTKLELLNKKETVVKEKLTQILTTAYKPSDNVLKKSTTIKITTESNLDKLEKDANNLSIDMIKTSGDIDEDNDSDWEKHEKEYINIAKQLISLQDNIRELRKQNISDSSKQQAIDIYRSIFNDLSKQFENLKKEVLNSRPAPEKSVRFNLLD